MSHWRHTYWMALVSTLRCTANCMEFANVTLAALKVNPRMAATSVGQHQRPSSAGIARTPGPMILCKNDSVGKYLELSTLRRFWSEIWWRRIELSTCWTKNLHLPKCANFLFRYFFLQQPIKTACPPWPSPPCLFLNFFLLLAPYVSFAVRNNKNYVYFYFIFDSWNEIDVCWWLGWWSPFGCARQIQN